MNTRRGKWLTYKHAGLSLNDIDLDKDVVIGTLIKVKYAEEYRLAEVIDIEFLYEKMTVKFLDNGEERVYSGYNVRIYLATARDVARWT